MKTFKEITASTSNVLLLVDALNMAFSFRSQTDYHKKYLDMVNSIKNSYKASKVIVCADKGSSSYRKALLPEYKYNRKLKRDLQTPEERQQSEEFFKSFEKSIEYLRENSNYPIIRLEGVEADDSIAYICKKVKKKKHIWILSSDGDMDLLIDKNVSRFSYVSRKEITLENWNEHYEYSLDDHISIKCLIGDTGDNIPGVPGIGPKKAHALVKEFGSTYDIISSLPISSKYKHISNLNEFGRDSLLLNYRLMDLVTHSAEALGKENCEYIDKELEKYLD